LNLNAVLLALLVLTLVDLQRRRAARAGLWIGLMTALKLYPGLLLIYLAWRKQWRGLTVGLLAAAGLTIGPLLVYGPDGALAALRRWSEMSAAGVEALHGRSQALTAVIARLGASPVVTGLFDVACTLGVLLALRRAGTERDLPREVAAVTLLALLLTPLAHAHYYLLALPAWLVVLREGPVSRAPRSWRALVGVAAILTSGILTVWSSTLRHQLLDYSIYAWGGLLLLIALLLQRPAPEVVGSPSCPGATSPAASPNSLPLATRRAKAAP